MRRFRKFFVSAVAVFMVFCTVGGMTAPVYASEASIVQVNPNVNPEIKESESEKKVVTPSEAEQPMDVNLWASNAFFRFKVIETEKYKEIPLYLQTDYPELAYGDHGSVASHGCGLVSLWMIATYLNDQEYQIEDLAEQFGDYNTKHGSLWILFKDSAEELGLDLIVSDCPNGEWYNWDMIMEALENDQPVIFLMNSNSLFTSSGHFIVLSGLTDDGKIIVNDPNGKNYTKNAVMIEGYENGFTEQQMKQGFVAAWIYEAKPVRYTLTFEGLNKYSQMEFIRPVA